MRNRRLVPVFTIEEILRVLGDPRTHGYAVGTVTNGNIETVTYSPQGEKLVVIYSSGTRKVIDENTFLDEIHQVLEHPVHHRIFVHIEEIT